MKDDFWFLTIFQDPLLTLIALILFSTIWIIIPKEPGGHGGDVQNSGAKVQREINKLTTQIREKQKRVEWLRARLVTLKNLLNKDRNSAKANRGQVRPFSAETEQLKDLIRKEKDKLRELNERLIEAEKVRKISKEVKKLRREIDRTKMKISENKKMLVSLRVDLKKAEERAAQSKTLAAKRVQEIEKLKRLISIVRKDIEKYGRERHQIQRMVKKLPGIAPYSKRAMEGKKRLYFEVSENKVTIINQDNYEVEVFHTVNGGRIVTAAKLTRKESVGDAIKRFCQKDSLFQKKLSRYNPEKHGVVFIVRSDSFDAFIKAREIAWKRGYVVGWKPMDGPIYVTSDGGGGELPGRRP